mmetsp:Transcript_7098/g.17315  ORF Transcript_7098/g.17315 Transcript_7098/m.17315 type:complete len:323 (+) Transcript_7098:159-1127(+)
MAVSKIAATSALSTASRTAVTKWAKQFYNSSATEATKARTAKPMFRYLSAWFCPFAHRATLALEHHSDRVDYEWIEALGWEQREDEKNVTGTGKEWWYHWKADELKRTNPSGLVPTLIPVDPATGESDESKPVFESLVTIDFVDEISGASGKDRLVSEDPFEAARCRVWADKVNRELCSPYYGVLVRKEDDERMEHFRSLINGLEAFSKELTKTPGPLFLADAQLSNVDLALVPWAYRYYVFEHYRGDDYKITPELYPELQPYFDWYDSVTEIDAVRRTLPDKDRYLEHIGKYADSSARSKVANAVRRGVAAHELDDEKDEY